METKNIYTLEFFIKKFLAIPEADWGQGTSDNNCVLQHCNEEDRNPYDCKQGLALAKILGFGDNTTPVYMLNDGHDYRYQQPTPKQRILAALYDIRAKQQPAEPKEKIIYKTVVIDTAVKELQETLTQN